MQNTKLEKTNTIVIADFDGTLTKKIIQGKRVPSSMAALTDPKYIGEEGVREFAKLMDYYHPRELDATITIEAKTQYMQEWWEKTYELLKKYRITFSMIKEVCHSPLVQFRDDLVEFLTFLHHNEIPLLIYSASGIGFDSIEYLLQENHLLTPNIKVCSNDLVFDSNDTFIDVKQPIIHSANKTGVTLIKNNFLSPKPPQRQCLLIGDSLDDVRGVEGIDFDHVIKVAFADKDQPKFKELYDLVLPIDSGYKPILSLFA